MPSPTKRTPQRPDPTRRHWYVSKIQDDETPLVLRYAPNFTQAREWMLLHDGSRIVTRTHDKASGSYTYGLAYPGEDGTEDTYVIGRVTQENAPHLAVAFYDDPDDIFGSTGDAA